MAVLLFAARFHGPIIEGTKRQTIRAPRKVPIRPGDPLSLRGWSGPAYRSPQAVLREARCSAVEPIRLLFNRRTWVEVAGVKLDAARTFELARADGFEGLHDFRRHWAARGAASFEGILIRWDVIP